MAGEEQNAPSGNHPQPGGNPVDQARHRWQALPPRNRLFAIAGLAAMVGVAVLYLTQNPDRPTTVLFANLSQEDAAEVVTRLRELNVPYELGGGGTTILVPDGRVHETRLSLAAEGLPAGGGVGFEIFDEQRFGESEFAEQVKYHRALEGELARTISSMRGVDNARVHLVLPERSLFNTTEEAASASVAVKLRRNATLGDPQIKGIVHLVASSVRDLSPERVTVVDDRGNHLSSGGGEEELAGDSLAFRRGVERQKEEAIQQLLNTTLGTGNGIARVSADITFTREERTEERFDPEGVAPRSYQILEEREGSQGPAFGGIPGTVSNLPGGEAPQAGGTASEGLNRRSETRNFEVSKLVKHEVEPVGRVEKLQVAVVVDGTWIDGKEGAREFKPRTEAELKQIKDIVASAAGIDEARGDRVTVECVPFAANANPEVPLDPVEEAIKPYRPYISYAAAAGGGLLFLLFLLFMKFRSSRKKKRAAAQAKALAARAPEALPTPISVRELEGKGMHAQLPGGSKALAAAAAAAHGVDVGQDPSDIRVIAAQLAEQDPEAAAQVVRAWLAEAAAQAAMEAAAHE